jgi:hypothetical protein
MLLNRNRRRIFGMIIVLVVCGFSTGISEPWRCGLCTGVTDYSSCFFNFGEYHLFSGLANSGYDGYHANEVCGTCNSSHITCGGAALDAGDAFYAAAKQSANQLVDAAAKHPGYIVINENGTVELKDCSGLRVALIEMPSNSSPAVVAVAP